MKLRQYEHNHIGKIEIKGAAYEDIMGILWSNGYETVIHTPSKKVSEDKDFREIVRTISIYEVTEE